MSKEKMRVSSNAAATADVREMLRNVSDVVTLCTCQQSKDFPYCDGTHNAFNKATNSNIQPLYVAIVEGKCDDCRSKARGLSQSMDQASTITTDTFTDTTPYNISLGILILILPNTLYSSSESLSLH